MSFPMTPAEARVDLSAIRDNVALLRSHAPGALTMVAVKADGYGHGMTAAARACLEGGAERLGTAYIREALELRAEGVTAPILSWIIPPGSRWTRRSRRRWSCRPPRRGWWTRSPRRRAVPAGRRGCT
nr:hypothetical protein GCM10020093_088290 [Planobispora longispora]